MQAVKQKFKVRSCGKCGNTFPVGYGHNARTCANRKQQSPPQPQTPPPPHPPVEFKGSNEINQNKNWIKIEKQESIRAVPRKLFSEISERDGEVKIFMQPNETIFQPLPSAWLQKYNYIDDGEMRIWFNAEGKLHRLNGYALRSKNGREEWWVNGQLHRLDGPAITGPRLTTWYVNGLDMAKHANLPHIPELMGDHFYLLCTSKNPFIRRKALENPNCPLEWKIAGQLMDK